MDSFWGPPQFTHGGNPNLISRVRLASSDSPLHAIIRGNSPDKFANVKLLIEKGTDLDHVDGRNSTPAMAAAMRGRYDIVLLLLEAGADFRVIPQPDESMRLIHLLVRQSSRPNGVSVQNQPDFERVMKWLTDQGQSVDAARADLKHWESLTGEEFGEKR
ncbi:MAG TPA: ankyrin repeat domain-containing protein [Pirellulales bacterium]